MAAQLQILGWLQVLAPHAAESLDRVYKGAGAALRLQDAGAPLAALLASWQPPVSPPKPPAGDQLSHHSTSRFSDDA